MRCKKYTNTDEGPEKLLDPSTQQPRKDPEKDSAFDYSPRPSDKPHIGDESVYVLSPETGSGMRGRWTLPTVFNSKSNRFRAAAVKSGTEARGPRPLGTLWTLRTGRDSFAGRNLGITSFTD